MREPAIEVRGLRKRYGELEAVRGVSLRVERGEVVALLGPNGAGKTTTVEILEGHRRRDGGEVRVLGFDPGLGERALRERIGIVLQSTGVEPYLTVEETVRLFAGYYPSPRPVEEVLELVGLLPQRAERVKRLSGGQQRRLDVAVGLAGDPDLLFLDEPTTGLDPAARRAAWQMIRDLRATGATVLLTTHYLDEAQALADRVAIMVAGRVVAEGAPAELVGADGRASISFTRPDGAELPAGVDASLEGDRVTISTIEPERVLHELTGWALERGVGLVGLTVTRRSLEDVFLDLAGEEP